MKSLKQILDLEPRVLDTASWDIERKISNLINKVVETNTMGEIVLVIPDEPNVNPYVSLYNSLKNYNLKVSVNSANENKSFYEMKIDDNVFVRGCYKNKIEAKRVLAIKAMIRLRKICFFVTDNNECEIITKESLLSAVEPPVRPRTATPQDELVGDPAKDKVQRLLTSRLSLFTKLNSLKKILLDGFTQGELEDLKRLALTFNMKAIFRPGCKLLLLNRIDRIQLVRRLLKGGGEEGVYTVHIPKHFSRMYMGGR